MTSPSSERYNIPLTALIIGVPVLVGASYYYYYHTTKGDKDTTSQRSANDKSKKLTPHEQVMHHKQIGNQNFSRKYYQVAIDHYNKGIELAKQVDTIKPDDLAIFYQNRAACNESLGNLHEVIADCNEALERRKSYTKAYLRRAKAYEKLEDYEKAMVDAFCASLLEKYQNQTSMILTDNLVKASSARKAAEAMKSHKLDWPSNSVIKSYFSAYTNDPIKQYLGIDNIRSSDQIEHLLDEAKLPQNESDTFWKLVRGTCYTLMGDLKQAEIEFDSIISDENCLPSLKANVLIKKASLVISESSQATFEKDLEQTLNLLEESFKLDPNNEDMHVHKAQVLTLAERLDDAVSALDKALELQPDMHIATAQKFYIEFKMMSRDPSKMKHMLEEYKEVVDKHPDSQDLRQMYAQILTELGQFEQADQELIDLAKKDPNDGTTFLSRALLQFHLKSDPDEIVTIIRDAIEKDPKLIYAYEILGSLETQRGNHDEAIKIFETALAYAQSESEYARCYSMIDSAKSQRKATEILGIQI